MIDPLFKATEHAPPVVASVLLAVLATYVALEFADRLRGATERSARWSWIAAGSVAMGTGIWAMHFVGMSAAQFPFDAAIDVNRTALSWLVAVCASVGFLVGASDTRLGRPALGGLAFVIGCGVAWMHFSGMSALGLEPALVYQAGLVLAALALAVIGAAVTMALSRKLADAVGWNRGARQLGLAVLFGGSLSGMHYLAMAATQMTLGAVCGTAEGLRVDTLGSTVGVASATLLVLMLLMTGLQARTERRAARLDGSLGIVREELRLMSMTDHATGLPNRLVFQDRLKQAAAHADRDGRSVAVMFVALDGFKAGRSWDDAGAEQLVRRVAGLLSGAVRGSDTVAAVGGEQFLVMMDGLADLEPVTRVAEALRCVRKADVVRAGVTLSIGIACYPADGVLASLVGRASTAAEAAIAAGGNCYRFFEAKMNDEEIEKARWLDDLREATQRGQMRLHYQPKFHADTGAMAGVEALLRWSHPDRGAVGPAVFIPLAEKFGLIGQLGSWVINEACRQMREWSDAGVELRVAINVSVHQVRKPGLADEVIAALERHGVAAHRLTCEITESAAMEEGPAAQAEFARLKAAGVQISIDDFGTGYASLSHLRKLPVHQLKVDRSFVNDVCDCPDARSVVTAIVELAHALRMEVVAEGVETECQREILKSLGCDKFQGFLFARPMPPRVLIAQIVAAKARPAVVPAAPPPLRLVVGGVCIEAASL